MSRPLGDVCLRQRTRHVASLQVTSAVIGSAAFFIYRLKGTKILVVQGFHGLQFVTFGRSRKRAVGGKEPRDEEPLEIVEPALWLTVTVEECLPTGIVVAGE